MTPIDLAAWLAVLLNADSVLARPIPTPPVGGVMGRVFTVARGDTLPARYANLVVFGTRIGTMTDETGAFVLHGLPPGRFELGIQVIGGSRVVEMLTVVAGQTTRRDFWVERPRYDMVRDSLRALGQWPPHPDPGLLAHMRAAKDVRVFRLGPPRNGFVATTDSGRWLGRFPIIGEGHRPGRHAVADLIEGLRVSAYEIQGFKRGSFCESFSTCIDVRFTREGVPVDVMVNYACYEVSIWHEGRWVQSGDFKDERLVAFAKHAFPHDPEIRQIHPPGHRSDR